MKKSIWLFIAVLLLAVSAQAQTTYYVSYTGGSDTNNGTSKSTPWQHAPGMTGCTANCSIIPAAGSKIILEGGVTWPNSSFVWTISYSGNGTGWVQNADGTATCPNCIYIGVDQTWYTGGSWTRPILNSQGAVNSGTYGHKIELSGKYIIVDNFEFTGNYWNSNTTQAYDIADDGTYDIITNNYFHGWSHGSGATTDNYYAIRGCNTNGCNPGSYAAYNVIDGTDAGEDGGNGIYASPEMIMYNFCQEVGSCYVGNWCMVHDNTAFNLTVHFDGGHPDIMQANSDVPLASCITGAPSGMGALYYNNNFAHICQVTDCGGTAFIAGPDSSTLSYIFNNLIYDTDANGGNVFALGKSVNGAPYGSGWTANNTIECGPNSAPAGNCYNQDGNVITAATLQNQYMITSNATPVTTYSNLTYSSGSGLVQTLSQANTDGYSMSQTYPFSPTSGSSPTVGIANNLTSTCNTSTYLAPLCKDTTAGVGYDTNNHTVIQPNRSPCNRPATGNWDAGAYEYSCGSSGASPIVSFATSPLAFGSVDVGSNSTLTETVENTGTATLTLDATYYTITGTNAADFSNTGGGTCANSGTVPATSNCTAAIKFTPSIAGAESATLNIAGNANGSVSLTGTGIAGVLTINPGPSTGTFVQGCSIGPASGSSVSCVFGSANTVNNSIICSVAWTPGTYTFSSISDSNSNSYGTYLLTTTLTGDATQNIYLATGITAGSNTVKATYTGSVTYPEMFCAEYQGPLSIDKTASGTGTGTALSTSSASTTNADDLLIGISNVAQSISAAGSGYTQRIDLNGDTFQDQQVTSTGSYNSTATQSPSGWWLMQFAAFMEPQGLVFPSQTVSTPSAAMSATITNLSTASVTLGSPYYNISGADSSDFAVSSSTCTNGETLTVGSSCVAQITFTPGASGSRTASFAVSGTTQTLSGTGASESPAVQPTFGTTPGNVNPPASTTITSSTSGATIIYTTDGSTPGTSSGCTPSGTGTAISNGGTVNITSSFTINAIACHSGDSNSTVATGAYTLVLPTLTTPTSNYATGTVFTSPTYVTLTFPVGSSGFYTTNGSAPNCSSTSYSSPILISVSQTIQAIACESGYNNSPTASFAYTVLPYAGTPYFTLVAGTVGGVQTLSVTSSTAGATIYYTINGTLPSPTNGTQLANGGTFTVYQSCTISAIAVAAGYSNSAIGQLTVTFNSTVTSALAGFF